MRWALPLLLGASVAVPAWGQDKPLTAPTRDVDVTYRALAGGQEVQQRSRFAAAHGQIRIDTPSPGLYMLINRDARTMQMVSDGDRSVLDLPYDPRAVGGVQDRGYTRVGTDTVAGTPCTEWRGQDASGQTLVFCVTADGVLLRVRNGGNVIVQATRVTYGPVPDAAFAVPAGYTHRQAPPR